MNLPPLPFGTRWRDTEAGDRVVALLGEGGNGLRFRREDDGSVFHCRVEDLYLWGRFVEELR